IGFNDSEGIFDGCHQCPIRFIVYESFTIRLLYQVLTRLSLQMDGREYQFRINFYTGSIKTSLLQIEPVIFGFTVVINSDTIAIDSYAPIRVQIFLHRPAFDLSQFENLA